MLDKKMIEKKVSTCFEVDFPGGSGVNNSPANAADVDFIPGSGGSPGEGNDNPLQYSCLENSMDRGAWWATVHGVAKELDTTEQLNSSNILWSGEYMSYLKTFKALFQSKSWLGQTKYTRRWVCPVYSWELVILIVTLGPIPCFCGNVAWVYSTVWVRIRYLWFRFG